MSNYLFYSERLGFRTWSFDDLDAFHELNSCENVMEHFPSTLSKEETKNFIQRLINHHQKHGFCYFAVELLDTKEFIGFIGLTYQTYETEFTPAVDIGWRLKKSAWGNGYATEGAKRCLHFAFKNLGLKQVISTCVVSNKLSENVMQNIGMTKTGYFNHPNLKDFPEYQKCVWYEVSRPDY